MAVLYLVPVCTDAFFPMPESKVAADTPLQSENIVMCKGQAALEPSALKDCLCQDYLGELHTLGLQCLEKICYVQLVAYFVRWLWLYSRQGTYPLIQLVHVIVEPVNQRLRVCAFELTSLSETRSDV